MHGKLNNRGFTLVEMIMAVAIVSLVLIGAYSFLNFSMRAFANTQGKFTAQQDGRYAVLAMKKDVRQARAATYSGTNYKAVVVSNEEFDESGKLVDVVSDKGMKATIYTDTDGDRSTVEVVTYKLEDKQLKRGEAALGADPSGWTVVADRVYNIEDDNIFQIEQVKVNEGTDDEAIVDGKRLIINLILGDKNNSLEEDPVYVTTSITVRSKGAME